MKIAALFATVALAQDMGDGRAMSLQKKIDNAGKKCSVYMEKAMVCDPPAGKIGKYNYRLEKVLKDAQHHLKVGKCDVDSGYGGGYRRRRDTEEELEAEFAQLMEEIDSDDGFSGKQYGSAANQSQVNKLESLCSKFINLALADDSLATCGKLGAWQKRADQIFGDLVAMKNVCIKQAQEADSSTGGGNSNYNGGGNNNNNNNNNNNGGYNGGNKPTEAPKPNKPYNGGNNKPKPTKKPKKPNNKY